MKVYIAPKFIHFMDLFIDLEKCNLLIKRLHHILKLSQIPKGTKHEYVSRAVWTSIENITRQQNLCLKNVTRPPEFLLVLPVRCSWINNVMLKIGTEQQASHTSPIEKLPERNLTAGSHVFCTLEPGIVLDRKMWLLSFDEWIMFLYSFFIMNYFWAGVY